MCCTLVILQVFRMARLLKAALDFNTRCFRPRLTFVCKVWYTHFEIIWTCQFWWIYFFQWQEVINKNAHLNGRHFIVRQLYKDSYWLLICVLTTLIDWLHIFFYFVNYNCEVAFWQLLLNEDCDCVIVRKLPADYGLVFMYRPFLGARTQTVAMFLSHGPTRTNTLQKLLTKVTFALENVDSWVCIITLRVLNCF